MSQSARSPRRPLTRRAVLGAATTAALTGCSLRWDRGSSLPGPTATSPSDIALLVRVRTQLDQAHAAAQAEGRTKPAAAAAARLHQRQLSRLDATIAGLGGHAPDTASPTSASWRDIEAAWVDTGMFTTMVGVSHTNRPQVMCIAATGLAARDADGAPVTFPATATFPDDGAAAALTALTSAITALEWAVARSDADHRGTLPTALDWMYAARSLVEPTAGSTMPTAPIRRYADPDAARRVAGTAVESLLTACARAAASATTPPTISGVLFIWSRAVRELERLGTPDTSDLPGLALEA